MQESIFKFPIKNNRVKEMTISKSLENGAKGAVSRYSRLMQSFDSDIFNNGNWEIIDTSIIDDNKSKYNFIDLFSGAGGLSEGARSAGLNKLFSVEIDNDASDTIKNNFPESNHYEGSIENLKEQQIDEIIGIKKVHVLCGGPPCQGFSVAGLRNPEDPRNQLFKEYIRIVKHLKPDFIVLENVPGILTMQKGAVYNEILKQLEEIGYPNVSIRILEAANYGVPQLRTRAIFVGNRLGMKNPYPKSIYTKKDYVPIEAAIDDLKDRPFDPAFNHNGTKHSKKMEKRLSNVPPGGSLYDTFRDAWKRQYKGVPSMTVKENHGGVHVHYDLNRVLTAREMARLQTFPDNYIFSGTFKRAYWQIGNAVPCLFAKHITLAIKAKLDQIEFI